MFRRYLLIFVAFLGLFLSLYLSYVQYVGRKVEARIVAIREAGPPISGEDLANLYPTKTGEVNGADGFITAAKALAANRNPFLTNSEYFRGRRQYLRPMDSFDDTMLEAAHSLLEEMESILVTAITASRADYFHFEADFESFSCGPGEWSSEFGDLSQLLALSAYCAVEEHEAAKALDAVKAIFILTRAVEELPLTRARMLAPSLLVPGYWVLEHLLSQMGLPAADLDALGSLLQSLDLADYAVETIIINRAQFVGGINSDRMAGSGLPSYSHYPSMRNYLDSMEESIQIVQLPYTQAIAQAKAQLDRISANVGRTNIYEAKGIPLLTAHIHIAATRAAQVSLVRFATQIEMFRVKEGRLPESAQEVLQQHAQPLPTDPYDGQILRYMPRNTGYIVYSVGSDVIDDGGTAQTLSEEEKLVGDMVFQVLR